MSGSRRRMRRGRFLIFLLAAMMVVGAALLWYGLAVPAGSADGARQVALAAARSQMQWYSGPSVQSTYTIPLRRLQTTLRRSVRPLTVATDVNVQDLTHRYGRDHQVVLVVLSGVYNSLPPDEGSTVRGDVVVLVDARSHHVILLQD